MIEDRKVFQLLISQRARPGGNVGHLSYGAWNEAEDVLVDASGVRLTLLNRHLHSPSIRARRMAGRSVRMLSGHQRLLPPTTLKAQLAASGHVFFVAHGLWDTPLLERLRGLRSEGITVSVWISEVWPSEVGDPRLRYECYSLIDHLFVAMAEAVEPLSKLAPDAQIHFLPPAADVMRFAPRDPFRERGISVLGIGRRDADQHREIREWAADRQRLYLYDTVRGQAPNWLEHREALASTYQHTNVAICNYAKHDMPELTGGLRLIPGRLFEGLAAGSVLAGMQPDEQSQIDVLGQTVVEPLSGSADSVAALLDRFSDPQETDPIRIRNLALACRAHDWAHRWKTVFEKISSPVPFGLQNRLDDLAKRAVEYEEMAVAR